MRAYLRVDPNLVEHKADYPDGAYRAFVDTLCYAEQQPKRGRFRSRKLLAVLLERRARWIPYLLEHQDLIEMPSGALYVDGWDEWQEGDHTVGDRMRRLRSRRRDVTPPDTPAVTPRTVTAPHSGGGKQLAVSGGGAPSRAPNGAKPNGSTTSSFMGFRPKADPTDVARQEAEGWQRCVDCGKYRRSHSSAGDHPFRVEQGRGVA